MAKGFPKLSPSCELDAGPGFPPSLGGSGYFWPPQGASSCLLELCQGSIDHKEVDLGFVAWGAGHGRRKDESPGPRNGRQHLASCCSSAGTLARVSLGAGPCSVTVQRLCRLLAGGQRRISATRPVPVGPPHLVPAITDWRELSQNDGQPQLEGL